MTQPLAVAGWQELSEGFPYDCVKFARDALSRDGFVELTAEELGGIGGCDPGRARDLLERLARLDAIDRIEVSRCANCQHELSPDEAGEESCTYCGAAIGDSSDGVRTAIVYRREAPTGRSVPWVLVLHGMNTRGVWQEELTWLVATTYGRSVPVFIYKYGKVRPGVFIRMRQRALTRGLADRLRRLGGEHEHTRLGPRPDVLAHSFGAWLIGHALLENPDLRVGRIVLMGSILRPDFPWNGLHEAGQVEAVLNHRGGRDWWVRFAGYFIPDSGPSGVRGFDPATGVINRLECPYGHSTFFRVDPMQRSYTDVWRPFLQRPQSRLSELEIDPPREPWRPFPRILRATVLRWVFLATGCGLLLLLAAVVIVGAVELLRLQF